MTDQSVTPPPRDGSETPLQDFVLSEAQVRAIRNGRLSEFSELVALCNSHERLRASRGQRPEDAPRMSEKEAERLLGAFDKAAFETGRHYGFDGPPQDCLDRYDVARRALKSALLGTSSGE